MTLVYHSVFISGIDDVTERFLNANDIRHLLTADLNKPAVSIPTDIAHKLLKVNDRPDANIIVHFSEAIRFISDAVRGGGNVLVHCQMGRSRSVTLVAAYIMQHEKCSHQEAIRRIRRERIVACPNPGFKDQLELFGKMGRHFDPLHPLYLAKFAKYRGFSTANSASATFLEPCSREEVKLEAYHKCIYCSTPLLPKTTVVRHQKRSKNQMPVTTDQDADDFCSEIMLFSPDDLVLSKTTSGQIACRCGAIIGQFNWSGVNCPCGSYLTPWFKVNPDYVRLDEVTKLK